MTTCEHCGTAFAPQREAERFCCRGCEFVAEMIREAGFERFYDLKQGLATAPVRSRPFEQHDFSWLEAQVARAEERAGDGLARLDCAIEGISCVGCVWLIERLFDQHPGAARAAAHPASGRLHLEWRPGHGGLRPFAEELTRFGYVIAPARRDAPDHERRRLIARLGLCGAFALNAMGFTLPRYLGMPPDFEFAGLFHLIAFLSATLAMLVGGSYFIERAWRAARTRTLHIDLPIALGLISAYAGSIAGWALSVPGLHYFDFVATFVFLMLGGRYLQTAAVDRNRRRLLRASPVPASVRRDGKTVPLDALAPGAEFEIDPGQALPVAATVRSDQAEVSLEWINGEADPVLVRAGGRLPAGAILLSRQPLACRADESWADSLLARLVAPGELERGSAGLQQVLRIYLVAVLLVGLGGALAWALAGEGVTALQVMISVFVVSCPCALGVAVPLADELAATRAERHGAFVRSASLWPRLREVRQVVFDKTGTLTLERPRLLNPEAIESLDDQAARALARLTAGSLHPISRTLLESLGGRGQRLLEASTAPAIEETPGHGVAFEDHDRRWSLGRGGWAGDPDDGVTSLCRDGARVAAFRFEDTMRPGAAEAVETLRRRGLRLWILSGDAPEKVAQLAGSLGIERAHGGLRPDEKAARVRELDRHDSLFLGDGANDSLAFDAAHVTGTPVVDRSLLEAKADFFTLGAGLDFLPRLFACAERRARGVRAAFAFAIAYNLAAVALCLAGKMDPLLAAILMPLSSVASVLLVVRPSRS